MSVEMSGWMLEEDRGDTIKGCRMSINKKRIDIGVQDDRVYDLYRVWRREWWNVRGYREVKVWLVVG